MKSYVAFLLVLCSKLTLACECPSIQPVSKDLCKKYDVIFAGRVDSVSACFSNGTAMVYFSIHELYKGTTQQNVAIEFDCSSACLMSFSKAEEWLIYAVYKRFDYLSISICSHSRKFFADQSQDFYQLAAERSFDEEKQFLKETFGILAFTQKNDLAEQHKDMGTRNEQPSAMNKLWLLLISFLVMAIIYFFTRNKIKK